MMLVSFANANAEASSVCFAQAVVWLRSRGSP